MDCLILVTKLATGFLGFPFVFPSLLYSTFFSLGSFLPSRKRVQGQYISLMCGKIENDYDSALCLVIWM